MRILSWSMILSILISIFGYVSQAETQSKVFRFHVQSEPVSLDPSRLKSTDANYFFNNIGRGLFSYSNEKGLIPEGAKSCTFETPLKLKCLLSSDAKWSDGSTVIAQDYVRSFRRMLSAASRNPSIELLKKVKNALAVNAGKKTVAELGVSAPNENTLIIDFETPDPDFLYTLTASVLVPVKNEEYPKRGELKGIVFNGPYRVVSWTLGRRLRLESNPFYRRGTRPENRPPVEILFVDDDQTALHLYEEKELTFLRRLPTVYIEKYKSRPDFLQVPMARFDYVGFGEELKDQGELRAALSYSADFKELQKIYGALGIPGCPGLPESMLDKPRCIKFDLARAQSHWAKVPEELKKRRYKFYFSKLGGDDVKRGVEWFQMQWKKNLGIDIDLEQVEQTAYLRLLSEKPPAIFRKGIGLERPTCLAALETFSKDGSENYLKLNDPDFELLIEKLTKLIKLEKSGNLRKPTQKEKLACGVGVQHFLDRNLLIPLGRIHFTLLADPAFTGWSLNEMNQLDLAGLTARSGG